MRVSDRRSELARSLLEHDYILLDSVGLGHYAEVFEVRSTHYRDTFCVKVSDTSKLDSRSIYLSEIASLVSLIHPNIISVFDAWSSGDLLYLILEFADGGSLHEKLQRDGAMPPAALAPIARQIITALAYCHAQGLAHRDIKPANILLDRYGRPKIADFGLAARCRAGECAGGCGSPSYMAPELLAGRARDAFACDIWALGVTLYELAVGRRPYAAANPRALLQEIAMNSVQMPTNLPLDMADAIESMLAFDPRIRPSAAKLADLACFAEKKLRSMPSGRMRHWRHLLRTPGSKSQIALSTTFKNKAGV